MNKKKYYLGPGRTHNGKKRVLPEEGEIKVSEFNNLVGSTQEGGALRAWMWVGGGQ